MFKIKSQVEVTRKEDSDIKRSGYQPIAGSYICPFCKKEKSAIDFIKFTDVEETLDVLITKKGIEINEYPRFLETNCISFIRKISNTCSNCDFPIDAKIVFFIQKTKTDWNIESEICYSNTLVS